MMEPSDSFHLSLIIIFFWKVGKNEYFQERCHHQIFAILIYFLAFFLPSYYTRSSLSSLISRTLFPLSVSFCLSLSFGILRRPSIPLQQKEFMNEERSPRDASGTAAAAATAAIPSSLHSWLSSNNRRIRSTGLVLVMSCEWSEWPWMGKYMYAKIHISARVNLVLSTGFLIGRFAISVLHLGTCWIHRQARGKGEAESTESRYANFKQEQT